MVSFHIGAFDGFIPYWPIRELVNAIAPTIDKLGFELYHWKINLLTEVLCLRFKASLQPYEARESGLGTYRPLNLKVRIKQVWVSIFMRLKESRRTSSRSLSDQGIAGHCLLPI